MTIEIERRVAPATVDALKAMGHSVNLLPEFTAGVGGMQGILIDQRTRTMTAGADPRRAGYAIGWERFSREPATGNRQPRGRAAARRRLLAARVEHVSCDQGRRTLFATPHEHVEVASPH